MVLSENKQPGQPVSEAEVRDVLAAAFGSSDWVGKKVLVLIPDNTLTCPMPMM